MADSNYYAKIGLEAAKRAAKKVIEQAHKDNQPMPIWDGEKIIYSIPPIPQQKPNDSSTGIRP